MKPKIKIIYSMYYFKEVIEPMLEFTQKNKNFNFDTYPVAGSFEIPFLINRNLATYESFIALGCIIKGKNINHEAISTAIFTNLQRISIENNMPIGNGIFNANNISL